QDMMSGTDAKIVVYARALDEATPGVDEDSVKVKHIVNVLDLTVVELGIRGMLVEDLPSLVLNGFYIVLSLSKLKSSGLGVEDGVYFSLMSFTFSTLMLGRKMGLPGQKKELKLKKRNLEAVMKEQDISLGSAGADA
ncbi:hypothetical protein TeGR_g7176, partial [Tetraparma gracilis]